MVGHGGSSAGSYLADPTSPIPSHCASIVATSTIRVNLCPHVLPQEDSVHSPVGGSRSAEASPMEGGAPGSRIFQRSISEIAGSSPVAAPGEAGDGGGASDDANSRLMYRKRNNGASAAGQWLIWTALCNS